MNAFSAPLAPFTWKPPSISPEFTDGAVRAIDWKLRPFGMRSISSAVTLCAMIVLRVSTSGAFSAVTCTASRDVADLQRGVEVVSAAQQHFELRRFLPREAAELEPHRVRARVGSSMRYAPEPSVTPV